MPTHVAVIGAGPASMAAADAAARAGARVTVVGAEAYGGRAGWHSLLPSKVLLTAADTLGLVERCAALGLGDINAAPEIETLTKRIRVLSHRRSEGQADGLAQHGVQFIEGQATFLSPHHLQVTSAEGSSAEVEADVVIVASGSVPIFPPDLKPDGGRIIAPRFAGKLDSLPASLIVVGGGITGTEFVYAFNRLGVDVTWIVDEYGVLPPFGRNVVNVLVEVLTGRGVFRHEGTAADSAMADDEGVTVTLHDGGSFRAEMAFIAVGRRPDVAGLNLEAAGLPDNPRRGIEVDGYGRSTVSHIYAAGDVTGLPMTANKAMAQGWIAGRHAVGKAVGPYRPETVVEAVYTDPQLAQVGLSESEAAERGHSVRVLRSGYETALKAALLAETEGFVKLVADADTGTLLGASAVGAHAADVLAPAALGIRLGAGLRDLAALFAAHPGLGELAFAAARVGAEQD